MNARTAPERPPAHTVEASDNPVPATIMFSADEHGRIRVDPGSWNRFTGLDADAGEAQEPGWGWLHAVPAEERDGVRAAWVRATSTQQVYALQHRLLRPDGSCAWVMAQALPVRTGNKVRQWVGIMTDVSERVRFEEAREQFIAVLGHDLRNPVSAILLSTELLEGAAVPEHVQAIVARIARSGARLNAMIRDMLDLSQGRQGHGMSIARRPCDLAQIARQHVDELRRSHPGRRIGCEISGDVTGEWDPDRLEQVLSNLIGNAIDQGTGPIAVSVADGGKDVILSVHDHGAPIPPDVIPTLFEPYRRKLGDAGNGLGLGLYIVSQIVLAHHATISVGSSASEGTTFTIRWPRRAPTDADAYRASVLRSAMAAGVGQGEK